MNQEIVINANSQGFIPDYYSPTISDRSLSDLGVFGRQPIFNPAKALQVVRNDPVVKAALTTLVDKVIESGWRIEGMDKKSRKKELEQKLESTRFNITIRKILYNLFLYNNCFIEVVKKGEELTDLNVLEYPLMRIDSKDNGDPLGYYQEVNGEKKPYWKTDKIVHIKLGEITNNVFSDSDIQAMYETILIKDYIRQWLAWFFGSNQMRGLFVMKSGANKTKVSDFISHIKASEKNLGKPVIVEGDVIYQTLNSFAKEGATIQQVLDWCDQQVLMLLQVPPIAVGMPDNSGRSNSVEQYQALNTRVLSIQKLLEDVFTFDLFEKIGFGKNRFKFGILDPTTRERVFKIVEIMKNTQFTDDAIKEFLASQNIVFETTELFKDPLELQKAEMEVAQGMEGMVGNKPQDSAPSRKRQDSTGNSVRSKANETVMVRNSEEEKFNKYPYVYTKVE